MIFSSFLGVQAMRAEKKKLWNGQKKKTKPFNSKKKITGTTKTTGIRGFIDIEMKCRLLNRDNHFNLKGTNKSKNPLIQKNLT